MKRRNNYEYQKNIGKNTIGDNHKMSVDLHTYNMSTHDLSTIFRNTQSAGTLVPSLVLLAQKGDTIDIDIESHVLTHPTVGPPLATANPSSLDLLYTLDLI